MADTSATQHTETRAKQGPRRGSRRFGYVVAIGVNALLIYVVNNLLEWEWPRFLTSDFEDVLGIITLSLTVSILVNTVYIFHDGRRTKAAGELLTAVISFVVTLRVWQVFPFDFSTYAVDWSWLVRTILVVGLIGTAIAAVVNTVKLVASFPGEARDAGDPPPEVTS